jgi:deoxyribose-phosphate aldolase
MSFNIAPYIDHTLLKSNATQKDIDKLCEEAKEFSFAAVCIPPYFVLKASKMLEKSNVKLCTVSGFPFGYDKMNLKIDAIKMAADEGAQEVDTVVSLVAAMSADWKYFEKEVSSIADICRIKNITSKLILETGALSPILIEKMCKIIAKYPIDFAKTSTGVGFEGATIESVKLLRANLPKEMNIKASGGIKDRDFAMRLIDAGASRIGSSASLNLI